MSVTSDPIVTQCPTLANPQAFTDVAELQRELGRANELVISAYAQMQGYEEALRALAGHMGEIVGSYVAGRTERLIARLDLLAKNAVVVEGSKPGKGVH
jgi:hypothetical protein